MAHTDHLRAQAVTLQAQDAPHLTQRPQHRLVPTTATGSNPVNALSHNPAAIEPDPGTPASRPNRTYAIGTLKPILAGCLQAMLLIVPTGLKFGALSAAPVIGQHGL